MMTRRGTHTEVGTRLATADFDYKAKIKDVRKTLADIEKELNGHEKRQRNDENNYGYVGDLGHVKGELEDVLRFLRGR